MAYNTQEIARDVKGNPVPQYYNPAADKYEAVNGNSGATFVLLKGYTGHVSIETNATTTEASAPFDVDFIHAISNDGDADIVINFDADTSSPGAITLKPGEVLEDFPRACSTLYYKAASGTQPFRAWGVK